MEDGVGIYIKKINDMIEKQINKNLKEYDLTMTQGRIIRYLNANKDKFTEALSIVDTTAILNDWKIVQGKNNGYPIIIH